MGRLLFELRPDIIEQPWLTDVELHLWALYFEDRAEREKQNRT